MKAFILKLEKCEKAGTQSKQEARMSNKVKTRKQ